VYNREDDEVSRANQLKNVLRCEELWKAPSGSSGDSESSLFEPRRGFRNVRRAVEKGFGGGRSFVKWKMPVRKMGAAR
jgi:hypothetical protein